MDGLIIIVFILGLTFVWVVIPFRAYLKPKPEQINIFVEEFPIDDSYPAQVAQKLAEEGYKVTWLHSGDLYIEKKSSLFMYGYYGRLKFAGGRVIVLFMNKILFDSYGKVKMKWFCKAVQLGHVAINNAPKDDSVLMENKG